jgi:hypothetical protein
MSIFTNRLQGAYSALTDRFIVSFLSLPSMYDVAYPYACYEATGASLKHRHRRSGQDAVEGAR